MKTGQGILRRIGVFFVAVINIGTCIGLVVSSLAGMFDPAVWPRLAIASMTFPAWGILAAVMLIVDFFVVKKWCVGLACAVAVSLPMVYAVFPLNITPGDVPERLRKDSWVLLTYNTTGFQDLTDKYPGDENATVRYILGQQADVVVLQETDTLCPMEPLRITEEQIERLRTQYPYIFIGADVTLLSRFPGEVIDVCGMKNQGIDRAGRFGCWVLDIHGRKVAIFGVHLKSIGLTLEDKALYRNITTVRGVPDRAEMSNVKTELIGKLALANSVRPKQTRRIINTIDSLGIEDVIVCGDFNDTPGCYSLRLLSDAGLREAYPVVGRGYMSTFNRNRFYFKIDHVLVCGYYRPWSLHRGDLMSSDHYPLTVTFVGER